MIRRLLALGLAIAALSGCWDLAPGPLPTPSPSDSASAAATGIAFTSSDALVGGRVTLHLREADGTPIVRAAITLSGPTPAWGITDASGDLIVEPLATGSYLVRAAATGFATGTASVQVDEPPPAPTSGNVSEQPAVPQERTMTLPVQIGRAIGRVLGNGKPLPGVVVSTGGSVALTDSQGTFSLAGVPTGTFELHLSRTGWQPRTLTWSVDQRVRDLGGITLLPAGITVSLENGDDRYDLPSGPISVRQALAPLREALEGAGLSWQEQAVRASVRLVAAPNAMATATVERLTAFVAQGGTLILMGEWGGAASYRPEALNRLASGFGVAIHPDLVRSSGNAGQSGWVRAWPGSEAPPAIDPTPKGVTLFDAASIFAPRGAWPVIEVPAGGYRIAAIADSPLYLAAAVGYGAGKVVLVGDTSAWTTGSITGNAPGSTNLSETNNRQFVLNLFRW